jgi:hypothetical protein
MVMNAQRFNNAERLYITEGRTMRKIAGIVKRHENTIRRWSKVGNWKRKRVQFIESKRFFNEELYEFAQKLTRSITADLDSGKELDAGPMNALKGIISQILKANAMRD